MTGNPVQLLAGRYGPYVTDGVTNASLPKADSPEEATLEYALNLLQARAEKGPAARPSRRRAAAKKAAKPKQAAKKKTRKKAAPKKTAKKKTPRINTGK